MQIDIDKEVALLQRMTVGQLREKFEETWGESTNTRNKQWLVKRIAWKMQANIEGDISQRARRRAAELARGTDIRTTAPKAIKPAPKPAGDTVTGFVQPEEDNRLPPPRSEIERVYKGEKIVVLVLENGFEYRWRSARRRGALGLARVVADALDRHDLPRTVGPDQLDLSRELYSHHPTVGSEVLANTNVAPTLGFARLE